MTKTHFHILLIEEDPKDVLFIQEIIKDIRLFTCEIIHITKISQIAEAVQGKDIDVVLTDLGLPDSTGINTVSKVLFHLPSIPIVVLTGLNDEQAGVEAILEGAQDYILKGQNSAEVLAKSISFAYRRQQIINELNKSKSQFRGIVENMEGGIVLIEDNSIVYVNQRFEEITGYTLQTLIDDFDKRDTETNQIVELINKIKTNDKPIEYERLWITNKNGRSYYIQCRVAFDVNQKTAKYIIWTDKTDCWENLAMHNFTNHLFSANILDAREEYFNILHSILVQKYRDKNIAFGLIEKNSVNFYRHLNKEIKQVSLPIEQCPCIRILKNQKNFLLNKDEINDAINKDGIEFPFARPSSFLGVGIKNEEEYVGLITISDTEINNAFNKNDLKWLENIAIQTSYVIQKNKQDEKIKQLCSCVEQSPACIVITNIRGNIEYVNPFFEKITGYSSEEVLNKNPRFLQSGQTPHQTHKELWETITNGKTWNGIFINKKKNGDIYYEEANIKGVKNSANRITHYVAVKTDITNRMQNSQELQITKQKAEESDKLKSMFLTNLSHEIRTPLNGILGFSKLLSKPGLTSQETIRYIKIIEKSGHLLMGTVHNILDLSSLQSGQIEAHKTSFSLKDLIADIYEEFEAPFEKKGIQWRLNNAIIDQPLQIITDKDLLWKALKHLISNALKFTNEGSVDLELVLREGKVRIDLSDTGIGIAESDRKKIFGFFVQANMKENRIHQGPGIGLSIAKGIVDIIGGELTLESEVDKGSTFSITFPVSMFEQDAAASVINRIKISDHSNVKVLIVEDDDVSSLYLATLLRYLNFETLRAKNGIEAYNIFVENRDVALIIMDINLPGQSGLKTTAQIREFDKDVLIFAQTAYTDDNNKSKALVAGCNEYIPKPIIQEDLEEIVSKYFEFD